MGIKIKGKSGGVLEIVMQPSSSFAEIRQAVRDKLAGHKVFFRGSDSKVLFSGKSLSETQKKEMKSLLDEEFGISNVLFEAEAVKTHRVRVAAERPAEKKDTPAEEKAGVSTVSKDYFDAKSVFVAHTLRSGQRVECEGDVVVLGDVNDGAEVIAGGSIAVMGTLRGLVHAGATGRRDVVVAANGLKPKQLRISGKIAVFPADTTGAVPEIAEYKQGSIIIRPLKPSSRSLS